jgi:3-hydroxyacyl-[acyl-carrier-protein] dehydratase
MFDIQEIMKNVPHRFPFLLIDRVIDFTPGRSVTTLKNVSINEAQFQGHFPSMPIFPGVYIIENMAQSACFLMVKSAGAGLDQNTVYYLGKVSKMIFKQPVRPGDQLITTVVMEKQIGGSAMVNAEARVDNQLVARGEMMFAASKPQQPVTQS